MNLVFGSEVELLGFWEYMFEFSLECAHYALKILSKC